MQLCQPLLGLLCYLILVPLRAHTGALFHLDDEYIKADQYEVSFVIAAACQFKHASGHENLSCLCMCMLRRSSVCLQHHGVLLHMHGRSPLKTC